MKLKFLCIMLLSGLVLTGQSVEQKFKTLPGIRHKYQYFGQSVSISGNLAIVGAYGEWNDTAEKNFISNAGAAYIYEKSTGGNWSLKQKLVASDRADGDAFGWDVAISGNYAVISSFEDAEDASGGNTLTGAGSAYIFERNGAGVWVQVQKIVASDRSVDAVFGSSVAIDGSYLVVAADWDDKNASGGGPLTDAGSAYIFERNGAGVWVQVKKVVASDREADDQFGTEVSINGNYLVVGAQKEDHNAAGGAIKSNAGSAYVFERNGAGVWNQVAKIVASDRDVDDLFGSSVSVNGNFLIVGARVEDDDASGANSKSNSGSAYIFERKSGVWTQVQKIVAGDREDFAIFGKVAISGKYALVGAYGETQDVNGQNPLNKSGAAYLFERNTVSGVWSQVQKINSTYRRADNRFGDDVSLSGNNMIVSSPYDYLNATGTDSFDFAGAAYIFYNCLRETSLISPTACQKYKSPKGKIYTNSAVFNDTLNTFDGCDSVITVMLTVVKTDKAISQNKDTLIANEVVASFQWIDCNTKAKISGATSRKYVPTKSGTYAVTIFKNTCLDTSACVTVNILSVDRTTLVNSFSIFPNPGKGSFELLNSTHANVEYLKIFDVSGKLVKELYPVSDDVQFDLSAFLSGLYLVELQSEGSIQRIRLVKE